MPKEETIEFEGEVIDVLPSATFKIKLDANGQTVLGHISGKLRVNNITVLLGDRVKVAISPYDITRGRIVWRSKK